MTQKSFPTASELGICFAHVAYQLEKTFSQRKTGIRSFQTWTPEDTHAKVGDVDVLVVSGFWRDDFLEVSPKLKFIQSVGAGFDQFPLEELSKRGIRLASASGVNRNAVSEHVFALILGLTRKIHQARDNQKKEFWRGMISNIPEREDELAGKILGIIGLGSIGSRVAKLAKAFDMRVIATKRDTSKYEGPADEVMPPDRLGDLLSQSDFVVLNCPLTDETRAIIDDVALETMKPSAALINVARGACVDEDALLQALKSGAIAGAGLDHFIEDPLTPGSPFWGLDNVIITPHTAGETQAYEDNLIDILLENISRLERGEGELLNGVI